MPFSLPSTRVLRVTWWHTESSGDTVQVSVAILDSDWEPLAEATQLIGPFDDPMDALRESITQARALADRQYPGQRSFLDA